MTFGTLRRRETRLMAHVLTHCKGPIAAGHDAAGSLMWEGCNGFAAKEECRYASQPRRPADPSRGA
ncbi:hypothetical protein HYPDE_41438 [Hyphomicrobium denitrificans 1NES1]|uniref:Uncharacterized protein n=1 Tax=Hyphomicrobium denitrificans 1NES1 TaxID=670307 RepID=N0BIJ8_9HYPH|nr:hypothetical protein HYPDE_41438 [Hyphomicrobium denitrificans 1NES1]